MSSFPFSVAVIPTLHQPWRLNTDCSEGITLLFANLKLVLCSALRSIPLRNNIFMASTADSLIVHCYCVSHCVTFFTSFHVDKVSPKKGVITFLVAASEFTVSPCSAIGLSLFSKVVQASSLLFDFCPRARDFARWLFPISSFLQPAYLTIIALPSGGYALNSICHNRATDFHHLVITPPSGGLKKAGRKSGFLTLY